MSGTNWIVIIGVVLLIVIGVWYYTGSTGGDGDDAATPVIEAPAADTTTAELGPACPAG